MSDPRSVLEGESRRFVQTDGAFERLLRRRDRKRRNQRIQAGVLGLTIAIAGSWLGVSALRSTPRVPAIDPTPTVTPTPTPTWTPTPRVWSPVHERGAVLVHRRSHWDGSDARVGWVDIRFVDTNNVNDGTWAIDLEAKPPRAEDRQPGLLIAYGLVLETTGDGVADYEVGIDNDAPEQGTFHIWVTDLATGETDEQVGPPYGFPIEFGHPDEMDAGRTMVFTFLPGQAPADFNMGTVRFYAWASATNGDEVLASDYAPDTGWMTRT
jgi:hypothetical protein